MSQVKPWMTAAFVSTQKHAWKVFIECPVGVWSGAWMFCIMNSLYPSVYNDDIFTILTNYFRTICTREICK
jgi:hypothetical protein